MATQPKRYISQQEYLEIERKAEFKSEYFNGEMFAMAGGTKVHGQIATNIAGELRSRLKGKPCIVYNSDVRVNVDATGLYTYPDVTVVCRGAESTETPVDVTTNPTLIVEVLSESTKDYDRGGKFEHYRRLPSLKEYLLVAQEKAHAEQFSRQPNGEWIFRELDGVNGKLFLSSLDIDLPLSEIYDKVNFE